MKRLTLLCAQHQNLCDLAFLLVAMGFRDGFSMFSGRCCHLFPSAIQYEDQKNSQGTKLCGIRQSVASSRGSGKLNKWDSVDKSKKYPVAVAYNSQLSFKSQSTLVVSYNVSYLFKEI